MAPTLLLVVGLTAANASTALYLGNDYSAAEAAAAAGGYPLIRVFRNLTPSEELRLPPA